MRENSQQRFTGVGWGDKYFRVEVSELSLSSLWNKLAAEMTSPTELKIPYDAEWGIYPGQFADKIGILQTESLSHKKVPELL